MIPTKEQEQALNKAYKKAGNNAYFGNGFNAGVKFALEYIKTCNAPAVSESVEPVGEDTVCPKYDECINRGKNEYCSLQLLSEIDCFMGQTER